MLVQPGQPGTRKTDRRDANPLGEMLWVNRHRLLTGQRVQGLRRVNIPGVQERDDRRLASLRQRVGRELTRAINRIHTVLRRRNLQHDCPTKTIQTLKAKAWLKSLAVCPLDRLVMHVLKKDVKMRTWYLGIKRRRGAKIARVAVMRRLTTILWHMLTQREAYQLGGVRRDKRDGKIEAVQTLA